MGILHEFSQNLIVMKRSILIIAVLMCISLVGISQQSSFILKREKSNPGVSCLNFSPDGNLLLVGYADGSFRVLDPENFTASLVVEQAHTKPVTAMDMPPKMDFIMTAGSKQIKIWGRDGKMKGIFNGHATTIWNADISTDGKYAVSTAFNKTFLLWDVYNGAVEAHMRGHSDVTLAACISPNDKMIASGSNDKSVIIWDLQSKEIIHTLHGATADIYSVCFSPDSRYLAVASAEKSIRVYDIEKADLVHVLTGHQKVVRKVAYSPDGTYIVSASEDNSLILWDVVRGEQVHKFTDNEGAILDVDFHPNGESFYSVSRVGDITRWELHPEIFVLRYYEAPYLEELNSEPLLQPRAKGEAKKEYQARQTEAAQMKAAFIDRYYKLYLQEHSR